MFTAFQVIHLGDKERPSAAAERSADGRDGRVVRRPAAESHSATNSTTLQLHHNLYPELTKMIVSVRNKLCSPFPTERQKPSIYCPSGKLALLVARPTKQNDNPFNTPRLLLKYHNRILCFTILIYTPHKHVSRSLTSPLKWLPTLSEKRGPTNE